MKFLVSLLTASSIVLNSAYAWGPDGHKLVGAIASKFLTPATQNALSDILGQGVTLESVANWADQVKHTPEYSWSEALHYIDTSDFECGFNRAVDCADNWCLATAIDNYTQLLFTGQDLQEAVKFLTHFIGDLSQPLHVGFASDEGGNRLKGTLLGKESNLHAIWDSGILEDRISADFSGDYDMFKTYLVARVSPTGDLYTQLSAFTTCSSSISCVDTWASESAANNCKFVYTDDSGNIVANGFQLGEKYYESSIQHVEVFLVQAGVRLAKVLNDGIAKANYVQAVTM